jgi:AraC family transcriptional regulator, arabinose operon regulatory protein
MVRRNGSPDWLVLYTFSGVCGAFQRRLIREMRIGDLIIFSPGAYQHIAVRAEENWSFFWAHFTPRSSWMPLLRVNEVGNRVFLLSFSDPAVRTSAEAAFSRCLAHSSNTSHYAAELGMTSLEEVLFLGAGEHVNVRGHRRISPEVNSVIEHCNLNYKSPQSLNDLSRIAHLSPSRFAHRFKAETGSSVISYLLSLRLRDAAQQLELTHRSVKAIALSVGFKSDTHFGRLFRKQYGQSPISYRRKAPLHM